MRIVATMLCKNEAWILRLSLEAALRWCDHIIFVNDNSTDESRTIAAGFANSTQRVTIMDRGPSEHWDEMFIRQEALEKARRHECSHVAIVDCDEILTHNNLDRVRPWFEALQPRECLDVPLLAPWCSLAVYSPYTRGQLTLGFRDAPDLCWKPRGQEAYQFHNRPPINSGRHISPIKKVSEGGALHLQFANRNRMTWKHRLYEMWERIRWPQYPVEQVNSKYHWWLEKPHGENLQPIPKDWLGDYPIDRIDLASEGWYKAECERLWKKHGAETFDGLELFNWRGE